MAVDKNKITAEATKFVQKGQFDRAIKAYERILQDDPKDVRVLLKVGELQQKRGDNAQAAETFSRVADTYGEQGFFLKAVAVLKQIVKLAPDDVGVNERLAGLYQQLGLMSDAMGQLQIVAAASEKAGDGARLLDVLRRMVELDPDNVASAIKLGELYAKAGKAGPALDLFRRAAAELKANNRIDEYLKVSERVAFLAPTDFGLTRELASIYLAKGDTKRALAKLQVCFKADAKDIETLNMLAQAFRDLGQTSKTVSVFKELAQVYRERGRLDEARATYRRVLELVPDDADAAEGLGTAAGPAPGRPVPGPRPGPPPGPRLAPRVAVAPPAPSAGMDAPRAIGPEAFPRVLTEADVYVKYGLHQKALDHLQKILAAEADNPDALEKIRDVQEATGNRAAAAEAAVKAVRACSARGLDERAAAALARLREIDPRHRELAALSSAAGLPEPEEEVLLRGSDVEALGSDALALSAAEGGDADVVEDEPGTVTDETALAAAAAALDEEGDTVDEPAPLRPAPPPAPRPVPSRPAAPPRLAAAPSPNLSDELEEADFYSEQGLHDEAREVLRGLLAGQPGHPAVKERLAALERRAESPSAAPTPAPVAPAPAAPGDGADEAFDIARELAEELGAGGSGPASSEDFQYSVEDVFNQFKKGVERTVKPEDSETHYDLGIAYKEMGLVDDAIHEFEVALAGHSKRKEVDCLTMIGLCRGSKGDHRAAVESFRRALRSGALTAEAAKALHYELALAHQALGEPDEALWYLQKVAKVDAGYRDARAMVERLGGGPGRPPAEPGTPRSEAAAARAVAGSERPGAKKNIGYV